jgi:YggT family protein
VALLLRRVIDVYLVILFARAITSWFPPTHSGSPMAFVSGILRDLTEPLLAPLRRVIPAAGPFDLSFTVLFFILIIVQGQLH